MKLEKLFHQLRNLLIALAGANREVLELVPSERSRFESLGWAILITSGLAVVSMWFALASAVGINGILAVPVALAWGLVIMGIDRWLITSMPSDGARKLVMAVPRLALAVLLGTLISTPLVLRVFQSEIDAKITDMQQQSYNDFLKNQQASNVSKQVGSFQSQLQYLNNVIATHGAAAANTASDPQLVTYNQQLTNLNNEVTHWTTLKNKYYTDYTCQLYGGPTCPKKGAGPAAAASLKNYQDASQEVDTLKGQINQVHSEIQTRNAQLSSTSAADQQARYQQALTQQPIVKNEYDTALQRQNDLQQSFYANNRAAHGILIRLEALSQLSNGNPTVTGARFLLFLLFLVIECLPVTVKLLQRPGLYEEGLGYGREAELRDVRKFYQFRSRLTGPGSAGWSPPLVQIGPEARVQAIWTPHRELTSGEPEEVNVPTVTLDDPGPTGRPSDRPRYGQARDGRARRSWYGEKSWRNSWEDSSDEEPPPLRSSGPPSGDQTRRDAGDGDTRVEYWRTADAPKADDAWDDPDTAAYDTDGYQRSWRGDGDRAAAGAGTGRDPQADATRNDPPPAPAGGGTPLSWDDDE